MNFLTTLLIIIGFIVALYAIYYGYLYIIRKISATLVSADEMEQNIRKSQVVDVREPAEFNARHILGARNIPISQFKMRHTELRKDQPIYLYDDSFSYAARAANQLRKSGYKNVYVLKGGFGQWYGKVKSSL